MKRRTISIILTLAIAISLVSFTSAPAFALRGYNYVSIESPDGIIYPDLEKNLERAAPYFFNNTTIVKMMRFGEEEYGFPAGFAIPDSFDAPITSTFIDELKSALETSVKYVAEHYPDSPRENGHKAMLEAVNELEPGEIWINAIFKIDKAERLGLYGYETNESYDTYYEYYFAGILDDLGLDDSVVFSASDSLDDIGINIVEGAQHPENLFYYHNFDYKIDAGDVPGGYVTVKAYAVTDWADGGGGNYLGTVKAYDAADEEIAPESTSERSYESNGYPESEREHVFRIPVKAGENNVRFAEINGSGDESKLFSLTINAKSSTATPTPAPVPAPSPVTVRPTPSTVYVNGVETAFEAYNIGGSNYFKLRDLAYVLNGTEKQFEVGYDNDTRAITLTSDKPYTPTGNQEMIQGDGKAKTATPTASKIYLDGEELSLTVYNIGGNNFFKLRDLMEAVDVYVGYDSATKAITLDTSMGYEAE